MGNALVFREVYKKDTCTGKIVKWRTIRPETNKTVFVKQYTIISSRNGIYYSLSLPTCGPDAHLASNRVQRRGERKGQQSVWYSCSVEN